jgi:hypothetical protein
MAPLTAVYFVAFLAGCGLSVASWLLGHHHVHHHGGHAGHGMSALKWIGSLFNVTTLAAFACVGGGVGLLVLRENAASGVSVVAAVSSGAAAAVLLSRFIAFLSEGTAELAPRKPGTVATVVARIGPGIGEVVYVQNGVRASLPARSKDGNSIPAGAEVIVMDVVGGVANVVATDELLSKEDGA